MRKQLLEIHVIKIYKDIFKGYIQAKLKSGQPKIWPKIGTNRYRQSENFQNLNRNRDRKFFFKYYCPNFTLTRMYSKGKPKIGTIPNVPN